jgi:hypothetical protein
MSLLDRLAGLALRWAEQNVQLADSPDEIVVKTTRYLRLGMLGLVVGLGASVFYEHAQTHPSCWQRSISAYYYTPVQSFFVAALVSIGIGMIVLKGNTEWEDVLLNIAGCFAPLVAFVPTPDIGDCGSVLTDTTNRNLNVANNVSALLILAGLALLFLLYLRLKPAGWPPRADLPSGQAGTVATIGLGLTVLLYLAAWLVFLLDRSWFIGHAHTAAAITMFAFIFLVVLDNAINRYFTRRAHGLPAHLLNRYGWLALAMLLAAVVVGLLGGFGHFAYAVIWIEASLISLFGIFWALQTVELWTYGLRTSPPPTSPPPTEQPPAPVSPV